MIRGLSSHLYLAAQALGRLGPAARRALTALTALPDEPAAARAIWKIAGDAVPMRRLLHKGPDELARAAGLLEPDDAPEFVRDIISRLGSRNGLTTRIAIILLGSFGSAARAALPKLREISTDPKVEYETRYFARRSVRLIEAAR